MVLRKLREALLAMPERRLIQDRLATPTGAVCSIGALAAHKESVKGGISFQEAAIKLAEEDPEGFDESWSMKFDEVGNEIWSFGEGEWTVDDELVAEEHSVDTGVSLGMSKTLAWYIAWQNDEELTCHVLPDGGCPMLSPEERWEAVFRWVERKLT